MQGPARKIVLTVHFAYHSCIDWQHRSAEMLFRLSAHAYIHRNASNFDQPSQVKCHMFFEVTNAQACHAPRLLDSTVAAVSTASQQITHRAAMTTSMANSNEEATKKDSRHGRQNANIGRLAKKFHRSRLKAPSVKRRDDVCGVDHKAKGPANTGAIDLEEKGSQVKKKHTSTCMYQHVQSLVYTAHAHTYTSTHTQVHTYKHAHIHAYMYTHVHNSTHMHAHNHIYNDAQEDQT